MSSPAQCLPVCPHRYELEPLTRLLLKCGTALGSSFDPQLIKRVGEFLAVEAKLKSAVVLLAPTVNLQRSPLGGRSFECFSEDPSLSGEEKAAPAFLTVNSTRIITGILAAAYVNGVQSQGVACTIKHFVCNEQEHERTAVDAIVSARALREVYLYPSVLTIRAWILSYIFFSFMLAQKYAKPWAFMTAYVERSRHVRS